MKKYLKIVLLVSMAVMFLKGLSVQAMEPVERDPKRIRLETNIFINNHELEISISELKRIINEEQDTQSWRDICNEVQVLILTPGDTPDEKFSDEEFRAMGNMVRLKSIRVKRPTKVYAGYNGMLYSKDLKVLYFCPPNIVGRAEVKIHKNTESVMEESVRRAEEVSCGNISLVKGEVENKRNNLEPNMPELRISVSDFKRIINEGQGTERWKYICNEVQVLILNSGDTPDEKFSDEEFQAMCNMVKLKSIRIIGSNVYAWYNDMLYSKEGYKVLYFCPPNIVGRAEVKIHKNTEFIMWQSVRRAEEISGANITLVNGNIKNKRYKYNPSGNYDDGVRQNFDSNGYSKEPSAAEKLKKERELHEHRKTVYPELSKCLLTPFKTLSAQLSCLPCKIGDKFSFDTPFGRVNCEKRKSKDDDNYYITSQGARVNTCYASMVKVITDIIKKYDGIDSRYVLPGMQKCKIINTIYNYINQPADPRIKNFEDFGRKKYDQSEEFVKDFKKKEWIKSEEFVKYLKGKECFRLEDMAKYIKEKECVNQEDIDKYSEELNTLAVLSAILMLSEPARNQMGGKYERAALREWLGHPDAMPSELRDRIIDFYRFSLRYFQGRKLLNDISSLNLGESDISEEVSRITEEYRQKIDNINSDNPSDESLKRELKLKKVDEGTGSMEKIFDNDTFKGGDKLKVPYLMSLEYYGKEYLNNLVDGRCHNEDQKEAFEYLNRSISPVRDCDADVVYQVE